MVPSLPFGSGANWLLTAGPYSGWRLSGLGTDVHFSGDESGMQWRDYLFELQNAVEWRMVMSRGADERAQKHAMSMLLNTCEGITDRTLIVTGDNWIQKSSCLSIMFDRRVLFCLFFAASCELSSSFFCWARTL